MKQCPHCSREFKSSAAVSIHCAWQRDKEYFLKKYKEEQGQKLQDNEMMHLLGENQP